MRKYLIIAILAAVSIFAGMHSNFEPGKKEAPGPITDAESPSPGAAREAVPDSASNRSNGVVSGSSEWRAEEDRLKRMLERRDQLKKKLDSLQSAPVVREVPADRIEELNRIQLQLKTRSGFNSSGGSGAGWSEAGAQELQQVRDSLREREQRIHQLRAQAGGGKASKKLPEVEALRAEVRDLQRRESELKESLGVVSKKAAKGNSPEQEKFRAWREDLVRRANEIRSEIRDSKRSEKIDLRLKNAIEKQLQSLDLEISKQRDLIETLKQKK